MGMPPDVGRQTASQTTWSRVPAGMDARIGSALPKSTVLTAQEVAKAFRVSEETIRREAEHWRDSGGKEGLPGFKVGRQWRFYRDALLDYLHQPRGND